MVHGLSCSEACGWDLPGSGMEPVSPALTGGFFTTESGNSFREALKLFNFLITSFVGLQRNNPG